MRKSAACDFQNTSWHPDFPIMMVCREEEMFDKKYEDLQLPTSRLVRRRRHLGRVYEQVLNTFYEMSVLKRTISLSTDP